MLVDVNYIMVKHEGGFFMSTVALILYGIGKLLDFVFDKEEEVPLWA